MNRYVLRHTAEYPVTRKISFTPLLHRFGTLRRIINEYLDGKSLLKIAEALNTEGVEYMPGTIAWNKARIMRILDDSRYIGTDSHPKLIEAKTYECIKTKKASKNNLKETDFNADIFKIADTVKRFRKSLMKQITQVRNVRICNHDLTKYAPSLTD